MVDGSGMKARKALLQSKTKTVCEPMSVPQIMVHALWKKKPRKIQRPITLPVSRCFMVRLLLPKG
jgi:hypothetical protein